jgi:hypothetical protein
MDLDFLLNGESGKRRRTHPRATVTWNLKDFPATDLQSHGVAAISPDDVLVSLHSTYRNVLIGSIKRARQNLHRTQLSVEEFIDALDAQGLTAFSSILRRKAAQLV